MLKVKLVVLSSTLLSRNGAAFRTAHLAPHDVRLLRPALNHFLSQQTTVSRHFTAKKAPWDAG